MGRANRDRPDQGERGALEAVFHLESLQFFQTKLCLFDLSAGLNRPVNHIYADVIEESLPSGRAFAFVTRFAVKIDATEMLNSFSSEINGMTETDLLNLPRPTRQVLKGSHYDVEAVDVIAGHVAGFLIVYKGVKGMTLIGPHL